MVDYSDRGRKRDRVAESCELPSSVLGQTPDMKDTHGKGTSNFRLSSVGKETDASKIAQRLKQISFGKNTDGYDNYIAMVPKNRRKGYAEHPRTPDAYEKASKRAFDGRIKAWRRRIHEWDNATDVLDAVLGQEERDAPIRPPPNKKNRMEKISLSPDTKPVASYANIVAVKTEKDIVTKSTPESSAVTAVSPSITSKKLALDYSTVVSKGKVDSPEQHVMAHASTGVTRLLMATGLNGGEGEGEVECYEGSGEVMLEEDEHAHMATAAEAVAPVAIAVAAKPKLQFPTNWADSDSSSDEEGDDVL